MMNKAQKKVIKAETIEELYRHVLDQVKTTNELHEVSKKDLEMALADDGGANWLVENTKDKIETYKIKADTYSKIAKQLLKLM